MKICESHLVRFSLNVFTIDGDDPFDLFPAYVVLCVRVLSLAEYVCIIAVLSSLGFKTISQNEDNTKNKMV